MPRGTEIAILIICAGLASLTACATPRMHGQDELNSASLSCGLALGELIQDEAEKKLLLMIRQSPTVEQRNCIAKWARANHLKAVFVTMEFPTS